MQAADQKRFNMQAQELRNMDLEPKSKYITKKSKIGKKRSRSNNKNGDDTVTE